MCIDTRYREHFDVPADQNTMLFEKSANYFDSEITPKRVQALLPQVKIIVIITDPGKRAYSWYQVSCSYLLTLTLTLTHH